MKKIRHLIFVPILTAFFLFSAIIPCARVSAATTMTLAATPNSSGNYISLAWTNSDKTQPYSYMLYSKSSKETSFQSIPAKSSVKVLNIYPDVTPTINFTTWQGQNYTLPQSAALKMWMETPNQYNSKGYGQGLISVDAVSITSFNANPDSYLKNADGTYKYDVLYFGAWDSNNDQDLSAAAEASTDIYIRTGRGVCFGHDTLVSNDAIAMPNFFKLAHYVNIETIPHYTTLGSTQITVAKRGLLTNYPWLVGDLGTVLSVPMSHSNSQIALGDIWMTYQAPYTYSGGAPQSDPSGNGSNNFYLTTWSNCALIQTDHSNGAATPDEQRVTANVLFYLAQITTNTSWDDHKGQDLAAPNQPSISGVTHNTDRTQYTVNYSSQDNAMGYEYYVEATGQNDGAKYDSPVVDTSIQSGMNGYSIALDNNPSGIPSGAITTTAGSYTFTRPSGSVFYVHIEAIDNVGNISPVATYHVDELISVTHPVAINYEISPDSVMPFTASDVQLINNSTVPVKVSVQSLVAAAGGSIQFHDVSPSKYSDWSKLSAAQTKSDIALALGIRETTAGSGTWSSVSLASPVYAADITGKTLLGTLNPNGAQGNLTLTAKCGLAWDKAYTSTHNLSLIFELTN